MDPTKREEARWLSDTYCIGFFLDRIARHVFVAPCLGVYGSIITFPGKRPPPDGCACILEYQMAYRLAHQHCVRHPRSHLTC